MKKKIDLWIVREQLPFTLPLLGLAAVWFASGWAQFASMLQQPTVYYDKPAEQAAHAVVPAATYIFLLGLALYSVASAWGKRIANSLPESRVAKAGRGFTTLAVIVALIAGAIYAIVILMTGLNRFGGSGTELVHVFSVYVPIILDAALLVYVILRSFVNSKGDDEDE